MSVTIGDRLLCKVQENGRFESGQHYLMIGMYRHLDGETIVCDLVSPHGIKVKVLFGCIFDYFYSTKELRKMKLKKLSNVI